MPTTAAPIAPTSEIRVGSNSGIHSPGVWKWFLEARRTQPKKWSVKFLKAFTCNRITRAQCSEVLADNFTTREEPVGENVTLVLTVPA